jgi:hypothetical protein
LGGLAQVLLGGLGRFDVFQIALGRVFIRRFRRGSTDLIFVPLPLQFAAVGQHAEISVQGVGRDVRQMLGDLGVRQAVRSGLLKESFQTSLGGVGLVRRRLSP